MSMLLYFLECVDQITGLGSVDLTVLEVEICDHLKKDMKEGPISGSKAESRWSSHSACGAQVLFLIMPIC